MTSDAVPVTPDETRGVDLDAYRNEVSRLIAEVRVLRDQRDKALASVSTILGESLRAVADGTDPSDTYIDAWPKLVAALTGKDTE